MPDTPQPLRPSQIAARLFIGFTVAIALVLAACVLVLRDPQPDLTGEVFQAAYDKWSTAAPADYDLELQLTGVRSDRLRVRVRDGEGVFLSINGNEIRDVRAKATWTVEGQFDYIRDDLAAAERADSTSRLALKARFDPRLGYPVGYRRSDLAGRLDTGWKLVRFEALRPQSPKPQAP